MAIQKGTGFTNLNRIMQANKGNKLGSTVSGGIQGQVQGVKTQVKSAQDQFNEEAQKNRLDTDEAANKRSEILGRFAPSSGTSSVNQTAQTQPVPGAATNGATNTAQSPVSDQEITDFTKYRTGTYTGPKELADATSLYGKAQQAEQLGGLSKSEGGRQELLRRFVGGNNYTTGQKQLDSTLLGQAPGQLGQAARQARGATNLVTGANAQAGNLATEYANRAKAFGEETTKKIGETKAPISSDLDKRVAESQTGETGRLDQLKGLQDLLIGTGDEYKGLDSWTRSGLALQEAADRGILNQGDINMLLGQGDDIGLLQRGANLGLDMNTMINERLTNKAAQNLGRAGVASDEDVARLNALDRLAGKQGTDLEFLDSRGKFAAGKTGFDTGSLEDYISKTEKERAATDKAYADKLAAEQARYLSQAKAYGGQALGGAASLAGTGIQGATDPSLLVNPSHLGDFAAGGVTGATNTLTGSVGATQQGQNAFLEGLTKLNVGGQSLANTEAGRQLLKAIELKSKLENEALGGVNQAGQSLASGISALGKGNIGTALGELSGVNLAKSLGGDIAKNVGSTVSNAVSKITGGGIKISDEDLKEDIDYNPKDVQKFMDRIKPAAYDYKDEVKDSPMASKNRELGVMAQDLEKTKLGKESVTDTPEGKIVDYDNLEPKMLASIAALNKRLKELESKK